MGLQERKPSSEHRVFWEIGVRLKNDSLCDCRLETVCVPDVGVTRIARN